MYMCTVTIIACIFDLLRLQRHVTLLRIRDVHWIRHVVGKASELQFEFGFRIWNKRANSVDHFNKSRQYHCNHLYFIVLVYVQKVDKVYSVGGWREGLIPSTAFGSKTERILSYHVIVTFELPLHTIRLH